MPDHSIDEIEAIVAGNGIAAITLDTSIFDQFGCNLSYKSLTALRQLKEAGIRVLFSATTMGEVHAHISKDQREYAQKLTEAINQFDKAWRRNMDKAALAAQIGLTEDPDGRADELIGQYLKEVGAEIVPVEPGVSVSQLVDRYFEL